MATNNYCNETLERAIAQHEPDWYVNLERLGLIDQDMTIVVEEAIINKQCTGLWLGWNKITSMGIATIADALKSSTSLQYLYLSKNNISDDGCQSLAQALTLKATCLKDLDLGSNDITDAGVEYLAKMLETNRTLQQLNVSSNRIGDRAVELLARVLSKQCNQNLQKLYLNSNLLIADASVKYLTDMLQCDRQLNTLWVQGCSLSDKSKHIVRKPGKSKRGNYYT